MLDKEIFQNAVNTEGWFAPDELETLANLVDSLKDGATVVEIGCWKGRSSLAILSAIVGTNKKLFSIDHFVANGTKNKEGIPSRITYPSYWSNIWKVRPNNHFVFPCDQVSASILLSFLKIDLILIDGPHHYAGVLSGYNCFEKQLSPNSYVLFHDYYDRYPGVRKVVDDCINSKKIERVDLVGTLFVSKKL